MNVRTIRQHGNYFTLERSAVSDARLSFKAIGVHTYLMSKGDKWEAVEGDLVTSHTDGRASVRSAIQELIDAGYMVRVQIRNAAGRVVDWRIDTYESPLCNRFYQPGQPPRLVIEDVAGNVIKVVTDTAEPESENRTLAQEPECENRIVEPEPESDFPQVEKPQVENRTLIKNKKEFDIDPEPRDDARAAAVPAPPVTIVEAPIPTAAVTARDDYDTIRRLYENEFGLLTPIIADAIKAQIKACPAGWLPLAIQIAVKRGNRRWAYVEGIIRRWQAEGFDGGMDNLSVPRKVQQGGTVSKSSGYGRKPQPAKKENTNAYDNDPEYLEFLASFVDARDGSRLAAD